MSSEAARGLGKPDASDNEGNQGAVKGFALRFYHEFKNDDVTGMAAEIAYHLIFAIPPLIILTVMVTALLNRYTGIAVVDNFHSMVNQHAPGEMKPVLNSVIDNAIGKVGGGAASFGVAITGILSLWSGSNAINSFIKGFNRMQDVEEGRSFAKKRLVALGLTLAMIIFIIVSFALFVYGKAIGNFIADQVGFGSTFNTTWNILRWPIAILLVMVLLGLLYYYGPAVKQRWKIVSIGAVVATLLWVASVFGFKLYLSLSNPGSTYGAFGGLIVFLFFLYVTAIVFLLGSELNAILDRMLRHDMAGAPVTERSTMGRGAAHEVTATDAGATRQDKAEERPAPRKAQSPRGPGSKEPTS